MKNMNELINLFVNNNMSREKATSIVESSLRTALDVNNGRQKDADSYIDFIYNIVENYYITVFSLNFGRKNEMIEEIVKYINNAYSENKERIIQSKDRINEFITTLIKNYNELRLNPTYESVLSSIEAFIGCENKLEIYGEEEKIINQLLANKENDLETVNNIIEATTILADEINIDVIIAIEQIMQEGLKLNQCTLRDIEMTVSAICDVLNKKEEKEIDEDRLQEFLDTILVDYKMYQEGKCEIERLLQNIQENTRDIKAESEKNVKVVNFQDFEKKPESSLSSINQLTNLIGTITRFPNKIYEMIDYKNASKKKKAFILITVAMLAAGAVGTSTHHFKAPVQAKIGGEINDKSEENTEDDIYINDAETQNDYNTSTSNETVQDISGNLNDLQICIYATTRENWGTHGPKKETDVVVMVDSYGGIYKVKYIDENGKVQEITTPSILDQYRDYLDIDIDSYVESCKNGSQEFSIEQSVEPQVYTLNADYQFTSKIPVDLEEESIDDEEIENNSETVEQTEMGESSETIEQDENSDINDLSEQEETKSEAEQITLKAGEEVFGYIVVKDGDIVVRILDKNKNQQDIPVSYFNDIAFDYKSQIEKELYGESINYKVTVDTPVYDFTHSTITGIIKGGETVQFDLEDTEHSIAKLNGYILGYLDENKEELKEKIEEWDNQTYSEDLINKIIDENIPVSPVNEQYYNIIRIPKDIENENIVDIFINTSDVPQMPDTKFNENHGTIIEVDTSKGANYIEERIKTVLGITGQPYGIQCTIESEDQLKSLTDLIEKIKSENGTYFKYGVILDIQIQETQTVYDEFYGQYVENQEYDTKMHFIEDSCNAIKGMEIPVSLLTTNNDNINVDKLSSEIPLTLKASRDQDTNEYSSEMQEYKSKLDEAGFKVLCWQDENSFRIAIDDEMVNQAIKDIENSTIVHPQIPYDEDIIQNDEEYTDNSESNTQSMEEDDEIEFYDL